MTRADPNPARSHAASVREVTHPGKCRRHLYGLPAPRILDTLRETRRNAGPAREEREMSQKDPQTITFNVARRSFGSVDGQAVELFTLTNGTLEANILSYGAIIQAIHAPDTKGNKANVALGFATLDDYRKSRGHFGAIAGRYANRIGGASFELDGHRYELPANNGQNTLHGGPNGLDKQVWKTDAEVTGDGAMATLHHVSPDGYNGFPGNLDITVTYTVMSANALRITYEATTDKPTVLNLTNHSYFNLSGEGTGTALDHELMVEADTYTVTDAESIPTGEIASVDGTPLDFRQSTAINDRIRDGSCSQLVFGMGYDQNYIIRRESDGALVRAARLRDPKSGRHLEVHTTEPAVQFYSGNQIVGTLVGTSGRLYRPGDGLCLETQHYPDSPNHPDFPSTVLRPGETYQSTTIYTFATGL
jgi:aldose 1-epimerase